MPMIVTQHQVVQAMAHWEKLHIEKHGPLDKVSMPKECSKLANLLGVMWFSKETEASIDERSETAQLIKAGT